MPDAGLDEAILEDCETLLGDYYDAQIKDLAGEYPDRESLYIEAADVYRVSPELLDDWRAAPERVRTAAERVLADYALPIDVDLSGATVRLTDHEDYLQRRSVTDLGADDVGDLVAVTGQLARITGMSPRLTSAVYECQRCAAPIEIAQGRTDVQEPHDCPSCERQGPFALDSGQSEFVDQRKIKLEEPIEERSQARGQSVPVYIDGDLCHYGPGTTTLPDHAGARATIVGVMRIDESGLTGRNSDPETDPWIEARAVVLDVDSEDDVDIEAHRETFEAHAAADDAVDRVAESLAPSMHASEGDDLYVARRACAAWLFNAYRADPAGGGSKRGDLHMCLIGDPGTGKSTLMQYCHDVLPNSEFRTGTGLTEAGLTSAAVQEEFAGQSEWTLQPGILPRADGGHCIIDEIDGVVDENTKAIHDALEGEQVIKADKAGIKADLPTRTALLAGGNPTYTRFDKYEPITEQIDLDPALFDRFDLVFALQDEVDEARDREKAGHALDAWDELTEATATDDSDDAPTTDAPVAPDVLRAWIAYARRRVHPTLTEAVKERLQAFYVEARDLNDGYDAEGDDAAVPATLRTLEAGVRLSIAFARLRLSETVEPADAQRAIDLTRDVVGLRFDPDSGEFDDARTGRGQPKSQRERRRRLTALLEDYDGSVAIETAVEEAAAEFDVAEDKIEHDIDQLLTNGELMKPATGEVRPT